MKLEPQFHKDFSSGQITNINENITPQNSLKLAINVVCDEEIGSTVSRLGSSAIGSQLVDNMTILGLHYFADTVGSNSKLLAAINAAGGATSVVYNVIAGSTIRTGLTASKKMRFLTFMDSVLMVNGFDAPASYDGSSLIVTGGAFDLANIPGGAEPSLCAEFLDRVYLAGDSTEPDRLYYSGVQSAGAVSWTVGNGYVDIEPEDGGGGITGLGKVPGYLLIFKERSMKRWNFDSAFPESLTDIGTPSHESIVTAGGICGFFSANSERSKGFYITNGGRPTPISHLMAKNIKKFSDAIPSSYYSSVSGWGDETHMYWSIGTVTVDGITYTNVVLRWSIKTGEWVMFMYANEFRVFSKYISSGVSTIVCGDTDGNIVEIEKSSTYTDFGSVPINWKIQTQEEKFGYNQKKKVSERMVISSRNARGAVASIIVDGKIDNPVKCGEIKSDFAELSLPSSQQGNRFEFIIEGSQTGGRAIIKEIEIPNVEVLINY